VTVLLNTGPNKGTNWGPNLVPKCRSEQGSEILVVPKCRFLKGSEFRTAEFASYRCLPIGIEPKEARDLYSQALGLD